MRMNLVEDKATVDTQHVISPSPKTTGDEMFGPRTGMDEDQASDDADGSGHIPNKGQGDLEGRTVGMDELADDGRRRCKQRHADDA